MATRDPRNNRDDLTHIPAMKPAHDEVVGRRKQSQGRTANSSIKSKSKSSGSGGGFFTALAFLLAIAAAGAAYYLWEQQQLVIERAERAEQRLEALEAQLASTGDEMSQSDAAVRVKLKELDGEVRKLWDNVWKKSKALLDEHSKNIKNLTTRTSSLDKKQGDASKKLTEVSSELTRYSAALDEVAEALEEVQAGYSKTAALREKLPQLTNMIEDHEARIKNNEEWVESINTFRRQVNQRLNADSQPANEAPQLQ